MTTAIEPGRLSSLRPYNVIVGIVLVAQAVAVYLLSNDFTLPITASYMEGPPGTPPGAAVTLLDSPIGHYPASAPPTLDQPVVRDPPATR